MNFLLDWEKIEKHIGDALSEDVGKGDITSLLLVRSEVQAKAEIVLKERCCLAGLPIVSKVFEYVDSGIHVRWNYHDGDLCEPGPIGILEGQAQAILKAERTALNFLQHLSGIATKTYDMVERVKPYKVDILDTRKTLPGWRHLAKYAVRMGGGKSHRQGLDDAILVKRNHFLLLQDNLKQKIKQFSAEHPDIMIVIEASEEKEFEMAMEAGADVILLDNFKPEDIGEVVRKWKGKMIFEASGNINRDNVRDYAKAGVERISIGSLTHSVRAIDFSLRIRKTF